MAISQYTARLSEKTQLNETYIFLRFELLSPDRIDFSAGQYLLLNTPTTPQKRQYSIVSAPRLDHAIELLVEVIPNGQASGYLNSLAIGDEVTFYAPAGEFFIKPEVIQSDEPLVFIGTGSGLAPLRAMILDLLRTKECKRPIRLYWGMRHAKDLFWLEAFEELKSNFPNFSYHITISQPEEEWTLCKGHVTNCLSLHGIPENASYYICGSPHMIEDVMKVLTSLGVDAAHQHHEKFTV
ncbi:hypothetical protein C5B42_02935 [Candidatus Cerribacteria bacterium 'Amazon FNV 2010 28 9']|uniref:FAD-binding FR-type domain-containing protein n=1 Tax=Candidatus Cerribacteria bacterium 'Amazon FNV 2010 28 9' TaxID=2081795 RepID=A0A317JQ61_9BACT|nr:MAG: hypothetical protein C5B42_02935 [Candidatus Cerribacteria bacterium 'Amazon FNV 2010 28 9']